MEGCLLAIHHVISAHNALNALHVGDNDEAEASRATCCLLSHDHNAIDVDAEPSEVGQQRVYKRTASDKGDMSLEARGAHSEEGCELVDKGEGPSVVSQERPPINIFLITKVKLGFHRGRPGLPERNHQNSSQIGKKPGKIGQSCWESTQQEIVAPGRHTRVSMSPSKCEVQGESARRTRGKGGEGGASGGARTGRARWASSWRRRRRRARRRATDAARHHSPCSARDSTHVHCARRSGQNRRMIADATWLPSILTLITQ